MQWDAVSALGLALGLGLGLVLGLRLVWELEACELLLALAVVDLRPLRQLRPGGGGGAAALPLAASSR